MGLISDPSIRPDAPAYYQSDASGESTALADKALTVRESGAHASSDDSTSPAQQPDVVQQQQQHAEQIYDAVDAGLKGSPMQQAWETYGRTLVNAAVADGATDEQIAYVIATALRTNFNNSAESAPGIDPANTAAQRRYMDAFNWSPDVGNRGGDDGYNYRGRGYVYLTGRANYAALNAQGITDVHGDRVDLLANPEMVTQDQNVASQVVVKGELSGVFNHADGNKGLVAYLPSTEKLDPAKDADKPTSRSCWTSTGRPA